MATEVTIPKLGLTMTEAKIVEWLKADGERVQEGEPLVVVMTAKVTCEIEAPATGVLHTLAGPSEIHKVSTAIGYLLAPDEPLPEIEPAASQHAAAESVLPEPDHVPVSRDQPRQARSSPAARRLARELGIDIAHVQGTGRGGRISEKDVQRHHDQRALSSGGGKGQVQATPLASRMAEVEGLDLGQIQGTGPDRRITEDDVLRVLEGGTSRAVTRPRLIPFTPLRQAISEGMMHSLHSMAQLTLSARADVTALVELREVLRQRWKARISYTDLIVKAVAVALREHPMLNSTLTDEGIVLRDEIDMGVAVALEQGLIVPVVRAADQMAMIEIHRALRDLTDRARTGTVSVDEVTGGTFTVTNLGMYGVETFTPIINPPESAILGVGCIAPELALRDGQVVARSRMMLNLTIDHRVIDGAPGAAFLQTVVQLLEHPALIFAEGTTLHVPEGGETRRSKEEG
jgi:pyruvate dehydrogenase E2 component (dihydrolipoamide acetyltransferase)